MNEMNKPSKRTKRERHNPNYKQYIGERREVDLSNVKIDYKFKNKLKQESLEKNLKAVGAKINKTKKSKSSMKPITTDFNPKALQKKYQRPYFSPTFNSYEADLAFISNNPKLKNNNYLFLININTRYLYILLLNDKETSSLKRAFEKLIYYGLRINSIRFDGESGLNSKEMLKYFEDNNISVYSNSSPYINKNKIVDRAIRTIRDMYYNQTEDKIIDTQKQHNILKQLVTIYNNTYHKSIGKAPSEMTYKDELNYIKSKQKLVKEINRKYNKDNIPSYEYGDPLLIYLNTSKTNDGFKKRRGNYNVQGTFVEYDHGNVVANVNDKNITVPSYHVVPNDQYIS